MASKRDDVCADDAHVDTTEVSDFQAATLQPTAAPTESSEPTSPAHVEHGTNDEGGVRQLAHDQAPETTSSDDANPNAIAPDGTSGSYDQLPRRSGYHPSYAVLQSHSGHIPNPAEHVSVDVYAVPSDEHDHEMVHPHHPNHAQSLNTQEQQHQEQHGHHHFDNINHSQGQLEGGEHHEQEFVGDHSIQNHEQQPPHEHSSMGEHQEELTGDNTESSIANQPNNSTGSSTNRDGSVSRSAMHSPTSRRLQQRHHHQREHHHHHDLQQHHQQQQQRIHTGGAGNIRGAYKQRATASFAEQLAGVVQGESCPGFVLSTSTGHGDLPKGLRIVDFGWTSSNASTNTTPRAATARGVYTDSAKRKRSDVDRAVADSGEAKNDGDGPVMVISEHCTGIKGHKARFCDACARARKSQQRKEQRILERACRLLGQDSRTQMREQLRWMPLSIVSTLIGEVEAAQRQAQEATEALELARQAYDGPLTNLMGRAEKYISQDSFAHTYYRVSLSWIARVCGSEEGGARGWRWESVPGGPEFVEFFQQLREMPNSKRFYECLRGGHAAQPVRLDLRTCKLPAVPPEKTLQSIAKRRRLVEEQQPDQQQPDQQQPDQLQEQEQQHGRRHQQVEFGSRFHTPSTDHAHITVEHAGVDSSRQSRPMDTSDAAGESNEVEHTGSTSQEDGVVQAPPTDRLNAMISAFDGTNAHGRVVDDATHGRLAVEGDDARSEDAERDHYGDVINSNESILRQNESNVFVAEDTTSSAHHANVHVDEYEGHDGENVVEDEEHGRHQQQDVQFQPVNGSDGLSTDPRGRGEEIVHHDDDEVMTDEAIEPWRV